MTGVARFEVFLSWCHQDTSAKDALLRLLEPNLAILDGVSIDWWEDTQLMIGEDWRRQIMARLQECHYGLLLLSPAFFASRFIRDEELPRFVGAAADRGALPVGLKRVPMDGSRTLHGVETRQIFTGAGRRWFTETRGAGRERFATDLATEIRRRILADVKAGAQ